MAKLIIVLIFALLHIQDLVQTSDTKKTCLGLECEKPTIDKKGIFLSRGWGAGGMPFGVLYMNPSYTSTKNFMGVSRNPEEVHHEKTSSNFKHNIPHRQKNGGRGYMAHSVVPQLFVSYGWGPLGK